jgi:hypothetical protein
MTRRALRQAIPLAVVILGFGLGHQYAAGGGVFQAESGLLAKARAMFAQLRAELTPAASLATDLPLEEPAVSPLPSEAALAQQLQQAPTPDVRVRSSGFRFTSPRRPSSCQH